MKGHIHTLKLPILAVEKNTAVYKQQVIAWADYGINIERCDSMIEAIESLLKKDFLFISINEDSINYLPQLKIMRDSTNAPIFINTSDFTSKKQILVIRNGGDAYSPWSSVDEDNVLSALSFLTSYTERLHRHKKAIKILLHDKIYIFPDYHMVFINDNELFLTKKEFDILYYLTLNRGRVLTYKKIIDYIWGAENDGASINTLISHIKKLRKKLSALSPDYFNYIDNVREVGYRISLTYDKKDKL